MWYIYIPYDISPKNESVLFLNFIMLFSTVEIHTITYKNSISITNEDNIGDLNIAFQYVLSIFEWKVRYTISVKNNTIWMPW